MLSRIIRLTTNDEFAHVSIALDQELKEMYSFGDTPEKEEAFEYIVDKICFEDKKEYISSVRNICALNNASEIECALKSFVEYFSRTHLRKEAYQFRGAYYINK